MGNPRKPTALKKQAGTIRPCRENPNEPQPPKGIPVAPDHLSERAQKTFTWYATLIHSAGYLTLVDAGILEQLAQAYVDWREAVEFLDKHGTTYIVEKVAADGSTFNDYKAFPQVSQRNDADKRLRMLLKDCGLTPSDRSKVSVTEKKEESAWGDLIQ